MLENRRSFGEPQGHGNFATAARSGRLLASSASSSEIAPANGGNVDRVLFKNLVEMVPLVESLMDRRANSSFTRRASVVYTPTPAQLRKEDVQAWAQAIKECRLTILETSYPKQVSDSRGRKTVSTKKRTDIGNNVQQGNQDAATDGFSNFSSGESENVQKDSFELTLLREQVDNLQRTLLLKEEALKSAEDSVKQMTTAYASINELKHRLAEKETLIKSANSELYNAKIKLADKQAALEKLEWEAKMSNRKVEQLQDESVSMDLEITALMQIFEELSKNSSATHPDEKITSFHYFEQPPPIDQVNETDMMKMEEARIRYLAALAAAKENPSDVSLALVAEARRRLQAFVF